MATEVYQFHKPRSEYPDGKYPSEGGSGGEDRKSEDKSEGGATEKPTGILGRLKAAVSKISQRKEEAPPPAEKPGAGFYDPFANETPEQTATRKTAEAAATQRAIEYERKRKEYFATPEGQAEVAAANAKWAAEAAASQAEVARLQAQRKKRRGGAIQRVGMFSEDLQRVRRRLLTLIDRGEAARLLALRPGDPGFEEEEHPRAETGKFAAKGAGGGGGSATTSPKTSAPAKGIPVKGVPAKGVPAKATPKAAPVQASPKVKATVQKVFAGITNAQEKQALKDGYRQTQAAGSKDSFEDFIADQAALYRHADETDPRFKTFFSGDTLTKLESDPEVKKHLDEREAQQKGTPVKPTAPVAGKPVAEKPAPGKPSAGAGVTKVPAAPGSSRVSPNVTAVQGQGGTVAPGSAFAPGAIVPVARVDHRKYQPPDGTNAEAFFAKLQPGMPVAEQPGLVWQHDGTGWTWGALAKAR